MKLRTSWTTASVDYGVWASVFGSTSVSQVANSPNPDIVTIGGTGSFARPSYQPCRAMRFPHGSPGARGVPSEVQKCPNMANMFAEVDSREPKNTPKGNRSASKASRGDPRVTQKGQKETPGPNYMNKLPMRRKSGCYGQEKDSGTRRSIPHLGAGCNNRFLRCRFRDILLNP